MAWYDGMSFERVDAEIQLGRAPVVDSEVVVPPGWVAWWAERGSWLLAGVRVREGFSCRACGRPLPLDCCSAECQREPCCEACIAQLAFLEAQGRFMADLDCALEAALPSVPLADLLRRLEEPA